MDTPVNRYGDAGWLGAIARILAFLGLFGVLLYVLASGYRMLPRPSTAIGMLLGASTLAAAALIAGAVLIRGVDGRSPAALGIGVSSRTPGLSVLGLLIGVFGLAFAAAALHVAGMLTYHPDDGTTPQWLATLAAHAAVFAIAALAEEAIFRGYPFQVLVRAAGVPLAVIASSIAFAAVHTQNPDIGVFALANIFLAGVVFAFGYLRTLSLWFVTALHLGWNWAMATLFDLPVSGIKNFDTPLYEPAVSGPAWFTGGEFGPEGGVVGTVGFTVALAAILRLRAVQADPGVRAAYPLVRDATSSA